jgi:hypothetical protein
VVTFADFLREQRRRVRKRLNPPRRVRLTTDGDPFVDLPLTELSDPIDACDVTTRGTTTS